MDITAYQQQTGCTLTWLAKRAECSVSHLHDVKKGRARPSLDLVLRIKAATGGAVCPEDFATIKTEE